MLKGTCIIIVLILIVACGPADAPERQGPSLYEGAIQEDDRVVTDDGVLHGGPNDPFAPSPSLNSDEDFLSDFLLTTRFAAGGRLIRRIDLASMDASQSQLVMGILRTDPEAVRGALQEGADPIAMMPLDEGSRGRVSSLPPFFLALSFVPYDSRERERNLTIIDDILEEVLAESIPTSPTGLCPVFYLIASSDGEKVSRVLLDHPSILACNERAQVVTEYWEQGARERVLQLEGLDPSIIPLLDRYH